MRRTLCGNRARRSLGVFFFVAIMYTAARGGVERFRLCTVGQHVTVRFLAVRYS
jgi:hypothetical protein